MVEMDTGYLTEQGNKIFSQMNAGQNSITYTRIVFSSDNLSNETEEQITKTVDLQKQEISLPAQSYADDNNIAHVRVVGNNQNIKNGFYVNTYGVYVKGDDGKELLYGVSCDDNPAYITPFDGVSPQSLSYEWKLKISRTDKINFDETNAIYATIDDLQKMNDTIIKDISNFNIDHIDHNFTAKLQHNGKDVVDSDSLSQALADFNSKDKNAVIDNHDGTVNINGQNLSVTKTFDASVDANTLTDNGLYHLEQRSNNSNVPNNMGGYYIMVFNDFNTMFNNNDILQVAYDINGTVLYRNFFSFRGTWTSWSALATTTYVDGTISSKTGQVYQNAVNTAKAYAVQDNHDGTITANGNNFNLNNLATKDYANNIGTSTYNNATNYANNIGASTYNNATNYANNIGASTFNNAVNATKGYAVQDNHDGTITVNGNNIILMPKYLDKNTNLNDVTQSGDYVFTCDASYSNIPQQDRYNGKAVTLHVFNDGMQDIYQTLSIADTNDIFNRAKPGYHNFNNWEKQGGVKLPLQTDINSSVGQTAYSSLNGVQAFYSTYDKAIYLSGFAMINDYNIELHIDLSNILNAIGQSQITISTVNMNSLSNISTTSIGSTISQYFVVSFNSTGNYNLDHCKITIN